MILRYAKQKRNVCHGIEVFVTSNQQSEIKVEQAYNTI